MKNKAAAVLITLMLGAVASGQTRPAARGSMKGVGTSPVAPAKTGKVETGANVDLVERLLQLWRQAEGGDALGNIKTRVARGHITMSESSQTGTFEMYVKAPRKTMMVANTPRGQMIDVQDEGRHWLQTPWGGAASSGYGGEALGRAASGKERTKWQDFFSAAALKGRGFVDGHEVIVLAATPHGGQPLLWHIDARTGLLRKLEFVNPVAEGGERLLGVYYDSYATVDGVKVAALFRQVYTNFTLTFRVTEVRHNVPIEDALFANPNGK